MGKNKFNHGDKVVTKKSYKETFNRKVWGTVMVYPDMDENAAVTIVVWDRQEGKVIPDHQDMPVLMISNDLVLEEDDEDRILH